MLRALTRHPDTPCAAVSSLAVEIVREADALSLVYRLEGALDALVLPPPAAPVRADELWRSACFEAFLRPAGAELYCEFNLAPTRAWAAYKFDSYRAGMRNAEIPAPHIAVRIEPNRFELAAALADLSPGAWRLGLCAVIEEKSGAKSYWALAHPPGKPDFHHQAGFVLEL